MKFREKTCSLRNETRKQPCGYRGDPRRSCHCTPPQIERYMGKISGPLLDRLDIHLEVPAVPFQELSSTRPGLGSADIRRDVVAARAIQQKRFAGSATRYNAQMTHRQLRAVCKLNKECQNLLESAMNELGLSARAHDKVLRVTRTIADLAGSEDIKSEHLLEAIQYRTLDRNLWT